MLKLIVISCASFIALASPTLAENDVPAVSEPAAAEAAEQANADVPQTVKDACQGDYEKYCSQHQPESDEVRVCMAGAFEKLSDACVTAILDSPLAEQAAQQIEAARSQETEAESDRAALQNDRQDTAPAASVPDKPRRIKHVARPHQPAVRNASAVHRSNRSTRPRQAIHAKVTMNLARARPQAHNTTRYSAYRTSKGRRSVAGYIKRGTGIAKFYVAKYTRIGFAKAFR